MNSGSFIHLDLDNMSKRPVKENSEIAIKNKNTAFAKPRNKYSYSFILLLLKADFTACPLKLYLFFELLSKPRSRAEVAVVLYLPLTWGVDAHGVYFPRRRGQWKTWSAHEAHGRISVKACRGRFNSRHAAAEPRDGTRAKRHGCACRRTGRCAPSRNEGSDFFLCSSKRLRSEI